MANKEKSIEKKPLKITETILRDAHQSLIATRMTTEQMLPIVDKMDQIGYHAVECWGGATFDASLRFLKEDPWERLRKLRAGFKNTKLQMLFRGQNILGYNHYADDVVEYFVQKSIANGIDIIRIFDCLNDLLKLRSKQEKSIETIVRTEVHSVLEDTVLEDILPLMTKSNSPVWVIDETREFLGTIPLSSLIIEVTGKDKEEINEIIQNAIDL